MRSLALGVVLFAVGAAAQEPWSPPPDATPPEWEALPPQPLPQPVPYEVLPLPGGEVAPPPQQLPPQPAPPQQVAEPSYYQRCFSYPAQVWVQPRAHYYVGGNLNVPGPVGGGARPAAPATADTSSGGGLGSLGDGKAALVLAVVLAMALPVIVYAMDGDADPVVVQRFHCPTFSFEGTAGAETGTRFQGFAGAAFGRFTFAYSHFGVDAAFDSSGLGAAQFATHLMLRITPKQHIEPSLALGYRRMTLGGTYREGMEVGLPHRYVFYRDGLRSFGLDVRPMLLFGGSGVDAGLEAFLVVPMWEFLHMRAGGRVFSYGGELLWGFSAGLNFTY